MKKILFILHTPPPIHGSSIIGQQIKNSNFINKRFKCSYINLGTSKNINEIGKNPFGKMDTYLTILFSTIKALIHLKPDLCYIAITAKGIAFFKDAIVVLLVKLFRTKLVFHFHNKGVSNYQNRYLYNIFYMLVFNNTNAILLSEYLYFDVQKYFPKSRVYYCPNGISDGKLAQVVRKKANSNLKLLFLSNLIESKGVYILLDACKVLKERDLNFYCTIVGAESNITAYEFENKKKSLELGNYIEFVGPKYGLDKIKEFNNTDIFVFPTYYEYETFGLVILEAMQFSIPVISTFEGAIPEIVIDGETGFLCKQKDAICLADKIEILIKNPELGKKMGIAGRKRYEENFTLEHFENRFVAVLDEILDVKK